MATTKDEMGELIKKMGETEASVDWYRAENERLCKKLQEISLKGTNYDGVRGGSGPGDPVGAMILEREKTLETIKLYERIIHGRMEFYAQISGLMATELTKDERTIILAKHRDRLPWDRVARVARMSRSSCIRMEEKGMGKLCKAWDRLNAGK